jgi:hypothetical protein
MERADFELFDRSLRHATETHSGEKLDAALDELGWPDALTVYRRSAVSLLFEHQGSAGTTSSALARVVANAAGIDAGAALVLPALGSWQPPGRADGAGLHVEGLALGCGLTGAATVAVPTEDGRLATVDVDELALRPVAGLDPLFGVVEVTGDAERATTRPNPLRAAWEDAVAVGHLAVGHELVGASRAMLELARVHALEREQFGRPIASFQAVRHRLAESFVSIEAAAAALDGAWLEPSPFTAAMAKAIAGRSARTVARHCQQVLAGIGFTTEHPLHAYVRRVIVLDHVLGSSRALTADLGEQLIRTREMPALLAL